MAKKVTPEEVGRSPELHKHLREFVQKYNDARKEPAGEGKHYKRTPFDRLKELGLFNSKGLAEEFNRILNKESQLSHAEREAVVGCVLNAAELAAREINARLEKEDPEKATPEKAPKKAGVAPKKKSGTGTQAKPKRSTSAKSAKNND